MSYMDNIRANANYYKLHFIVVGRYANDFISSIKTNKHIVIQQLIKPMPICYCILVCSDKLIDNKYKPAVIVTNSTDVDITDLSNIAIDYTKDNTYILDLLSDKYQKEY